MSEQLTTAIATTQPKFTDLPAVTKLVLAALLERKTVEEISPGRLRLVPSGQR